MERKMFTYNIMMSNLDNTLILDKMNPVKVTDSKNINNEMNSQKGLAIRGDSKSIIEYLKSFSNLIKMIDGVRRQQGRIKSTANNPNSSRSKMYYEFTFQIQKPVGREVITIKPVLTVEDLPGLENPRTTYITRNEKTLNFTPLVKNPLNKQTVIPSLINNPALKELKRYVMSQQSNTYQRNFLNLLITNPIMLGTMDSTGVFDSFNYLFRSERFANVSKIILQAFLGKKMPGSTLQLRDFVKTNEGGFVFTTYARTESKFNPKTHYGDNVSRSRRFKHQIKDRFLQLKLGKTNIKSHIIPENPEGKQISGYDSLEKLSVDLAIKLLHMLVDILLKP